jgi:hypothetical protein
MRRVISEAIGETVRDMLNSDLPVSFTKSDFDEPGCDSEEPTLTSGVIRAEGSEEG